MVALRRARFPFVLALIVQIFATTALAFVHPGRPSASLGIGETVPLDAITAALAEICRIGGDAADVPSDAPDRPHCLACILSVSPTLGSDPPALPLPFRVARVPYETAPAVTPRPSEPPRPSARGPPSFVV
jgi:hypothetical protein